MERLTSEKTWEEASKDLQHELGYSFIWKRLNQIENILGKNYDLNILASFPENYFRYIPTLHTGKFVSVDYWNGRIFIYNPLKAGFGIIVNDKIIYLNQGYSLLSDVVFEKDSLTDECLVITRVYSDSCLSFRDCKPEYVEWLNPLVYKYDK